MNVRTLDTFGRFLLSGAFNTAVTYALYLLLLLAFPYWFSYSIAYAAGILLAYVLSRDFVFGRSLSGRRLVAFPLVYAAQYAAGLLVAFVWVDVLHLPAGLAPIAALAVTVPMTYLLTRWVFQGGHPRGTASRTSGENGVPALAVQRHPALRMAALLTVAPALLVLVLWMPFGFRLAGLIEEWDVLGQFARHGAFFVVNASTPMAIHALRPLTVFPHAIAYTLAPDSFAGFHLLTIAALVVKGAAGGFLAWIMTRSAGWALACSLLVLVFPADTMQLAFRGVHINLALAALLVAGTLSVAAHDVRSRRTATVLGTAGAALFLGAMAMYEAAFALLPLPVLVLYVAKGWRGTIGAIRARPEVAIAWLAAPLLFALYAAHVSAQQATYQASIASSALVPALTAAFPKLFTVGGMRSLVGGWVDAAGMLRVEYANRLYVVSGAAACCVAVLLARRLAPRSGEPQGARLTPAKGPAGAARKVPARLAFCGILLMLLGYAPFLFSGAHMAITQRTYLFATPGATFVWVAALIALGWRARAAAALAFAVLVVLGTAAQLYQFHRYVSISEQQRTALRSIVENFDGNLGDRTLILLDGANRLNHTWMLRDNMQNALAYLYGHDIASVEICLMPSESWQHLDTFGRPGECHAEAGGWRLRAASPVGGPGVAASAPVPDRLIPASKAVVLRIGADGAIAPDPALDDYRKRLVSGEDTVARRYRGVLLPHEANPLAKQFADARESPVYRTDFGRWWSIEEPIHGSGWREADWDIGLLHHDAASWSVMDTARLVFDIAPRGRQATVRGWFNVMTPAAGPVRLRLNGQPLAARWTDPLHFEATVPAGALVRRNNVLEIDAHADPAYYGLGAKLSRLDVDAR